MKLSLLLILLTAGVAAAETSASLLEQVKGEAKAEAKGPQKSDDAAALQRAYQMQEFLRQLSRNDVGENPNPELIRAVEGIGTLTGSAKLAELCQTLSRQLQAEEVKRNAALADELEQGFAAALRTGLAAKSIQDLDAPMAAVARLIQKSRTETTSNAKLRNLGNQGQQLWQFLRQWQDYVAGIDSGEDNNVQQRFQNLLRSTADFSAFIPRSELLERLTEIEKSKGVPIEKAMTIPEMDDKIRKILAATHSLDDLPGAIEQLQELTLMKPNNAYSQVLNTALQNLRSFQRIRLDLDKGLATTLNLASVVQNSNAGTEEMLIPVRAQLLLYAMPRLLAVAEADHPKPTETLPTYLQRIAASARERSDWMLLSRTVDLMRTLNIESTTSTNDRTALQSFLAGLNQEQALQYTFAVVSYEAALKAGSQLVSAELIGGHLERIRKEHPEEYERGVQIALNPAPTPDPRSRMMFPPGFPYPPGAPAVPPQAAPPVSVVPSKSSATPNPQPTAEPNAAKPKP